MTVRRAWLFWVIFIATLVSDQMLKVWVQNTLQVGEFWKGGPWHGVFEITLTYNRGIAFGLFQGSQLLMAPIALIIAGLAVRSVWKNPYDSRWMMVSLGLLASGAIGNLIDRVLSSKGVTDMFLLRLSNLTGGRLGDFWVFNIADVCISTAMVMLAITWMKPEKTPDSAGQTEPPSELSSTS